MTVILLCFVAHFIFKRSQGSFEKGRYAELTFGKVDLENLLSHKRTKIMAEQQKPTVLRTLKMHKRHRTN